MSALKTKRKKLNYERDVPRCRNCKHIQFGRVVLRGSLPVGLSAHVCLLHSWPTLTGACCDTWESKAGEQLERPVGAA